MNKSWSHSLMLLMLHVWLVVRTFICKAWKAGELDALLQCAMFAWPWIVRMPHQSRGANLQSWYTVPPTVAALANLTQ